jgi:hypothetical protein
LKSFRLKVAISFLYATLVAPTAFADFFDALGKLGSDHTPIPKISESATHRVFFHPRDKEKELSLTAEEFNHFELLNKDRLEELKIPLSIYILAAHDLNSVGVRPDEIQRKAEILNERINDLKKVAADEKTSDEVKTQKTNAVLDFLRKEFKLDKYTNIDGTLNVNALLIDLTVRKADALIGNKAEDAAYKKLEPDLSLGFNHPTFTPKSQFEGGPPERSSSERRFHS